MGSCFGFRRPVSWADDDDGGGDGESFESGRSREQKKVGGGGGSTEVIKIKITKKQLEEILRRAEGKEQPIQKVVEDLVSMGEASRHHREQNWKPALQSIPEAAE